MQFIKLKIVGFKSFVDPVEFRIEPGLTGVVGPNGCGKSNLMEALRWVMGANSAKAMRASGMDDVIFSGTVNRPGRNHAEVALTIDNTLRLAPAQFNDLDLIEVSRKITRSAGSAYRINGKDVRAKDVQLLFADASTGANSPSLVRQGQIAELIAAKPQNRRRILEEAAGVAGLHTRRHEAELRLRAAETNLERLEEVLENSEERLRQLRRQARQADRYRRLSTSIRALETHVWTKRWEEACGSVETARQALSATLVQVETLTRQAALAAKRSADASAQLEPVREESAIASAVFGRLEIKRETLERESTVAREEIARRETELTTLIADAKREKDLLEDADSAKAALLSEIERLAQAGANESVELERTRSKADDARAAREQLEAELEALAASEAERIARVQAARKSLERAQTRYDRLASDLAAQTRKLEELEASDDASKTIADARRRLAHTDTAIERARGELNAAEKAKADADLWEKEAREAFREAERALAAKSAESKTLRGLLDEDDRGPWKPVTEDIAVQPGYERALAAALGEDLEASLDPDAPAFWSEVGASGQTALPSATRPLSDFVRAPRALEARLSQIAVVESDRVKELLNQLLPGQRLVTLNGALWRWDGFVCKADAPSTSAVRLERKNRLAEIEAEREGLLDTVEKARGEWAEAREAAESAQRDLKVARQRLPDLERAERDQRKALGVLETKAAETLARLSGVREAVERLKSELDEASERLADLKSETTEDPAGETQKREALAALRTRTQQARQADAEAQSRFASVERTAKERRERETKARAELEGWASRQAMADNRVADLIRRQGLVETALSAARTVPGEIENRRKRLLDEIQGAEARRARAQDAFAKADQEARDADRLAREAEAALSKIRESKAADEARLEAAKDRKNETSARLYEAMGVEPDALIRQLADQKARSQTSEPSAGTTDESSAVGVDPHQPAASRSDTGADEDETTSCAPGEQLDLKLLQDINAMVLRDVEAELEKLKRQRENMGPVNLRADEEAAEELARMETVTVERVDLLGAIAKLREGVEALNSEGRERLTAAFDVVNGHFQTLFQTLFNGGEARLELVESDDPLEAGLEVFACPPGKRLGTMSLMSGGEQALTATALIFAVFLSNPSPICALDEVDAPLDDANVDRYCRMLDAMRHKTDTRFIVITHNAVTMSRMDRLFGVTMAEKGVSQLVSVDLKRAEQLIAAE